jgi:DNA-binding FadR family transcriptional regulator
MAAPSEAGDAPKPRSKKISELVARDFLRRIGTDGLVAGDSLPNERDAMDWLGVSRASLREGLRLLEAHGVVAVRSGPGGGPVVREAHPETLASSTTLLLEFLRVDFGEVIDARIAFEPQIAEAAAHRRDERQLARLMLAVGEMSALAGHWDRFQTPYNTFHRVLAEATGNRVLLVAGLTFRKVWDVMHSEVRYAERQLTATVRSHQNVAEAVLMRDGETARQASRAHLVEYKQWVERHQPDLLHKRVEWVGTP